MTQSQEKVISIAAFRAARQIARPVTVVDRPSRSTRAFPSAQSLEHRRRMLGFLRTQRPLLR